jgi:hypothetical protein
MSEDRRETTQPLLAWPPPGLTRLRGDLWQVIATLGAGATVFTLPLLATLSLSRDPWRLGVFGDAWWIVIVTSIVGMALLLSGYVQLFRVFLRWRAATGRGYGPRTVALVLIDREGDTGFLAQGARAYSLIPQSTRSLLLTGRISQAALLLLAEIWMSAGFMLGVLVAAHGGLGPDALMTWTLLPVAVPTAVAFLIRASENTLLVSARRQWYQQPWSRDLAREEIAAWHAAAAGQADVVGVRADGDGAGRALLTAGAATTAAFGLATLVLAIPLVVASGIGPVLASIAAPTFSTTMRRAATAEALESLRPAENGALTPREAGEALHSLSPSDQGGLFRPPPRSYEPIPIDDARESNPTGVDPYRWAEDLVPMLGTGALGPDAVAYLEGLGRLPALEEWHVLGTAPGLDELGARYVFPLPDTLSMWTFPIPRMSGLREAAYAQIGAAVGAAASGRTDEAETRLRELIGAGLLLGRDGETLIGNLIGFVLADMGGEALANLYDATGRAEEGTAVRHLMEAGERAVAVSRTGVGSTDMDEMPPIVTDSLTIRGLRWEYFSALSTLGPCLNLNRVVFGPPADYDEWLEEAHAALVRTGEEDELFQLARRGWGVQGPRGLQPVVRLFAQMMGGGVESCATLAAAS